MLIQEQVAQLERMTEEALAALGQAALADPYDDALMEHAAARYYHSCRCLRVAIDVATQAGRFGLVAIEKASIESQQAVYYAMLERVYNRIVDGAAVEETP